MIEITVIMKATNEPLKRTPVTLRLDAEDSQTAPVLTDRDGVARFDLPPASGKVLVSGVERYHGRLAGRIPIELWSITQSEHSSLGMPGEFPSGSNAYAGMTTQTTVRDMIAHFRRLWGTEAGGNRGLHRLFPRGGPQKQGNRLAGLLRTKGEH